MRTCPSSSALNVVQNSPDLPDTTGKPCPRSLSKCIIKWLPCSKPGHPLWWNPFQSILKESSIDHVSEHFCNFLHHFLRNDIREKSKREVKERGEGRVQFDSKEDNGKRNHSTRNLVDHTHIKLCLLISNVLIDGVTLLLCGILRYVHN